MSEQLEIAVARALDRYHDSRRIEPQQSFFNFGAGDGAEMLRATLEGAVGTQAEGGPVGPVRLAVWVATLRAHLEQALSEMAQDDRSSEHVRLAANSLAAMLDIQALLDPDTPTPDYLSA